MFGNITLILDSLGEGGSNCSTKKNILIKSIFQL